MLPDLSPHLHTIECNELIDRLKRCLSEKTFGKFVGQCSYLDEAVWQCTKAERIYRRSMNQSGKYNRPVGNLGNLPEEYHTSAVRKVLAEQAASGEPPKCTSGGCKL
uniref:COX assembly mitochondrial protein n=1 Tax=Plectus sambesii TaxID=2011161 RepID=A0A914XLS5_9BILA